MNKNFGIETRYNTLKMHKENYDNDLKIFLESHDDNREIDFLEIDLFSHKEILDRWLTGLPNCIKSDESLINQRRISSQRRIIEFTENRIVEIENELKTTTYKNSILENSLNWQGTPLQFTELTKALIQSNLISPELSENERFKRMRQLFNINEFNEGDKLKDIRRRTNTPTPLLNILETSLNNWIKNKD